MKRYKIWIVLALFSAQCLAVDAQEAKLDVRCKKVVELALQNNIKMRDARLEIESAKVTEEEAMLNYLPTVSAGATYFHGTDYLMKDKVEISSDQQQQIGQTIQALGLDPTALGQLPSEFTFEMMKHGVMVDLMAMMPLYSGGRITTGNKLAALQTQVKEIMLEQNENDVAQTAEKQYYQLLCLYEKQNTLAAAARQLESIQKDADNAYNAGVANKNDVLTVQLKRNELQVDSLKLANGIELARLFLAQYIGVKSLDDIGINAQNSMLEAQCVDPSAYLIDHQTAINDRPEWKLLNKNVEAQELQTKLKQGEKLPTVAIGAVGYYSDMTKIGRTKGIGLATVSVPISAWWSNKGVKRQRIATQMAKQDREDNRQLLLLQMQSAYNDFNTAYQQIAIARKSIEQSDENLRLNHDLYQAGMQTMSDLLDAQTKCQQSRDQLTDAVANYLNCRTAYLIATGRH